MSGDYHAWAMLDAISSWAKFERWDADLADFVVETFGPQPSGPVSPDDRNTWLKAYREVWEWIPSKDGRDPMDHKGWPHAKNPRLCGVCGHREARHWDSKRRGSSIKVKDDPHNGAGRVCQECDKIEETLVYEDGQERVMMRHRRCYQ